MIIKNIGSKIINIGTEILMPDSQITVSKDVAALPAIQAFAAKKYIKIVDNEKKGDDSGLPAGSSRTWMTSLSRR